jgi:hypothetical protein
MSSMSDVRHRLEMATAAGYRCEVRHQPAAEHEFPDWIVVIHTPDDRVLFPDGVDDTQDEAMLRALARIQRDTRSAAAHAAGSGG